MADEKLPKAKYRVGETVFYIKEGDVLENYVTGVHYGKWQDIWYCMGSKELDTAYLGVQDWLPEYRLFKTKAALLKAL